MLKKIFLFSLILTAILTSRLFAQNTFINKDFDYYFESNFNYDSSFHYTIKPFPLNYYKRSKLSDVKIENKFLGKLYNENFVDVGKKKFNLIINPILNSSFYNDFSEKKMYSDYKAGLNLQFKYKNKLFFNSAFFIAQTGFPSFDSTLINEFHIVPHYGKYMKNNNNALMFYSWIGNLTYRANKNILFSAGRGKHFFGNGYRSLFLSDNSNTYPYVKAEVDIWKIKYLWMFAKLSDINLSERANPLVLYDKAAFTHYFSINITKRINFDFFETVITNPFDSEGRRISYDAVYYNPVIFYRPAEFYKGTSDNSLMGIAFNIRLLKSTFLYSQFILDDMLISSLRDGSGWWGNKFGIQAGVKIYNLLKIKGLFARGEINFVRPYTFSHGEAYITNGIANLNYGTFVQEATHPYGANFVEGIAIIRYVKGRFSGKLKIDLIKKGEDSDTVSYGGNIYKSYNLRPDDYGIKFLQGALTDYQIIDFGLSYLINSKYGLMLKTGFYYRKKNNQFIKKNNSIIYFGLSSSLFNLN